MLAEQASAVFVTVLVAALAACIALLALDARQGTAAVLNQMIGATKIAVFLDSRTSRQDAESIGAQLKAESGVRDARFRSKEEALSEIEANRRNSISAPITLPDAWVLSLQPPVSDQDVDMPSLISAADQLQKTTATFPGVESVRLDRLWVAQLDRWVQFRRDSFTGILVTVVGVLLASLFGIFYLASRALLGSTTINLPQNLGSKSGVFTYIGIFLAAFTGIATFLLHGLIAFALGQIVTSPASPLQTWLAAFGHSRAEDTLIVATAILLAALVTALFFSRRR